MRKLVLSLLLIVAVTACSQRGFNSNVHVTPQPVADADLSAYRTWDFAAERTYAATGLEHVDTDQFRIAASKNFRNEMTAHGYTESDEPDLVFLIHVSVEQAFDEQKMESVYRGYDMAWTQVGKNDVWNEGTMVIFAMDAKTGKQVWSSTAQARLQDYTGYQDRLNRFNKIVSMMLADFPKRAN